MPRRTLPVIVVVIAGIFTLAPTADAELFLDLYGGVSLTRNTDVDTTFSGTSLTFKDVQFENSWTAGARFGYWLGILPFLGLALDGSYFQPDIGAQTITTSAGTTVNVGKADLKVGTIAGELMLRLPLGFFQPYLFGGPAAFIAVARDTGGTFGPSNETGVTAQLGFVGGAGAAFVLTKFFGVFAEYRFTHFRPEVEFQNGNARDRVDTDVNTNTVVGGVTFRF